MWSLSSGWGRLTVGVGQLEWGQQRRWGIAMTVLGCQARIQDMSYAYSGST